MTESPLVCTLTEPELRDRRAGLLRRVRERVAEARPLAAPAAPAISADPASPADLANPAIGVELRFAGGDEATIADVLELVRLESRCCAFLRFRVTLEPGHGPVVLEISGPPGAAEILAGELMAPGPAPARGRQSQG
jgi:hypothetical protein